MRDGVSYYFIIAGTLSILLEFTCYKYRIVNRVFILRHFNYALFCTRVQCEPSVNITVDVCIRVSCCERNHAKS